MKDLLKSKKETKDVTENMSSTGSYIIMLTEAEKKARDVIDAAKKRKAVILKKARDDSTHEIEEFRKEREHALKSLGEKHAYSKDTAVNQFQADLEHKKAELAANYKAHSEATLNAILYGIQNVKPKFHENLKK